MLEMLLITYKDVIGEDFPLERVKDLSEIEIINLVYDCVQNNRPYGGERTDINRFPSAPGLKEQN